MPLFFVGKEFRKFHVQERPMKKLIISSFVWLLFLMGCYIFARSYMDLVYRRYTLYPLCYVVAIVGTLIVSEFSVIMCRFANISKPIIYLGKNSLYMLFIHILDEPLLSRIWKVADSAYVNTICRISVDCIVFSVLMFLLTRIKKHKSIANVAK